MPPTDANRAFNLDDTENAAVFDLAPVSLWLEDFSDLRRLLAGWAEAGVKDMCAFIAAEPDRLITCLNTIRILTVNAKTLTLYEAANLAALIPRLPEVLTAKTIDAAQIAALWEGAGSFYSTTVNYTLTGRRLDIQLRGTILPGHETDWGRLLLVAEDVSDLQAARHAAEQSEAYALALFEHSPVALTVLDCSAARQIDAAARDKGQCLREIVAANRAEVVRLLDRITILDVNRQAMRLYGVADKAAFLRQDFRHGRLDMQQELGDLLDILLALSEGSLHQEREFAFRRLDGQEIHLYQRFQLLPGHEHDWARVQVSETDITARKKAEAHIRYLQDHDTLTHVHSRQFFNEEIARLMDAGTAPISIVVADINGLKTANDCFGHAVGDQMLRQVGMVLKQAVARPWSVARTGGDEFAILMPGADEMESQALVAQVTHSIVALGDAEAYGQPSLSMGAATRRPGELLEATTARADAAMYRVKQAYYDRAGTARYAAGAALYTLAPES